MTVVEKILLLFFVCFVVAAASDVTAHQTKSISRIAGGSLANIEDYPYTVAVHYDGDFACGGVIISAKWFVTAARCIGENLKERFTAYVGSSQKYTNGTDYYVSQIIFHPKYEMYGSYQTYPVYDISVLRVKKSFVFNEKVQPIKLPSPNHVFPVGSVATITGWGAINDSVEEVYVNSLSAVSIPIISHEECEAIYGQDTITRTMFCAGLKQGGSSGCDGDIGGPLVVDGVLAGILSWGAGCGDEYPNVFSNVTFFRDWILTRTGV